MISKWILGGTLGLAAAASAACGGADAVESADRQSSGLNATYYVSPSGSDSNAGTLASPWRTLGRSVGQLGPGDTLYARGGTYVESISVGASGTAAAPIRILAYPGERPVIDGQRRLPTGDWSALVDLHGSYVQLSGFEVKNSNSRYNRGVSIWGHHDTVTFMDVHDIWDIGILISGDYGTVEDSKVWSTCLSNPAAGTWQMWGAGLTAARDWFNDGVTSHATIRRNKVYDNWGEGLSTFESSDVLIEDNVVFNNWSVNLYVSNTWNTRVQRNLVFVSPDTPIYGPRRTPSNIALMDEVTVSAKDASISVISHDNTVVNNITWGSSVCLMCWSTDSAKAAGAGLRNVLFAYNTVTDGLSVGSYAHAGSRVMNNLFPAGTDTASRSGVTFLSNLAGDAQLAGTPALSNTRYSADWARLGPTSPAKGRATAIASVTGDYFGGTRGATPDIGAHEADSGTTPGGLPDVVVTSLTYANGVFTATVKNQGTAPTPPGVVIGVGYFVDGAKATWGIVGGPLAPGASVTVGTDGGAYAVPSGAHVLTAFADDVDRFPESNEGNNRLAAMHGGALADVVVTSVKYANGAFTATVKNQGTAPTPPGVVLGVGYFVDGAKATWGVSGAPLAPGASVTVGTGGGTFAMPAGRHTITAFADDVDRFPESDEGNNRLSASW